MSHASRSSVVFAFRWVLGVAAVSVTVFWFVYRTIDPSYYDPLVLRLGFSAALAGTLGLTFASRTVRQAAWPVTLAAATALTVYFAWLGSVNGLDVPWTVGALTAGCASALAIAPYARTTRGVWGSVGVLAVGLIGTLLVVGVPFIQLALMSGYFLVLAALAGLAAMAQVRTRDALREGRDALRAREQLLRTVIDAIPEHIYVKDREGRCLVRNRFSADSMGFESPDHAIGLTVFDTSEDPEVAAGYWDKEDRVMRSGEAVLDLEEPYAFDGERGWIVTSRIPIRDDTGAVTGLVGVTRDVTEQKRSRAELLKAKETAEQTRRQLRTVIDAIPDCITVKDREGRCITRNLADARIMGYDTVEESVGMTLLESGAPPELARRYHDEDLAVMETGQPMIGVEGRRAFGDGWKETTKVPLRDEDGAVIGIVSVMRDITERKEAEARIIEAKDAAEEATRAKSEFLANMSHEIRTPMNGVIGMTSLLMDTPLARDQRDFVETIRSSGEALLTIINDILDFSKIEAGMLSLEVQPFEVRTAVEEALDLVAQPAAEKGVELAYLVEDGVPRTVRGDVTRVRQVLVNLLSNAVKFTQEGSVCVRVEAAPPDPAAGSVCRVRFAVEDTGIGIAPDKLETVFESFSQADASTTRQFGGTGLGLTICRRLVDMMGGEMEVESEVGAGSTFRFSVEAEVAPSERRVFLRSEQPVLQGRRVLVVDDNDVNREILTRLSARWRMAADAVHSGAAALDAYGAALAAGRPYDLVLLDMQMPSMDGLETATRLRAVAPPTPPVVVMLTSIHREGSLQDSARNVGIDAVLYKPTKPSQLYDVLIDAFEGRPAAAAPAPSHVVPADPPSEEQPTAWISRPTPTVPDLRILLAEDNVVNQKVAVRLLDRLGYPVDVVANGAEALMEAERQAGLGEPYDIVFMDVQMPVMDGLEATRAIRASAAIDVQPDIIALTANAMEGDRETCLAAGADDYLPKPVQLDAIRGALDRALGRRAPRDERESA